MAEKIKYIGKKKGSLTERIRETTVGNWIKFSLLTLLTILFALWACNPWVLLVILLWADIYVTRFIAWDGWKQSKNHILRNIADWVDAIVFALVAVYFINIYIFQMYTIPTSSLEKTLLVGDFLYVSKVNYGPRSPMTPLSFPLAQHTLPILKCKSYIDWPQWEYKRLEGLEDVNFYDIVVFNFPAGDTVCSKVQNPDYYQLCSMYGRQAIIDNPDQFGEIIYRPVDRRENYIKRCTGLPGDVIQIADGQLYRNGEIADDPETLQFNYFVEVKNKIDKMFFAKIGVSAADYKGNALINNRADAQNFLISLGYKPNEEGMFNFVYCIPLTEDAKKAIEARTDFVSIRREPELFGGRVFPQDKEDNTWTRDNFGPIRIPKRGEPIQLTADNILMYSQLIRNYEGNTLEVRDGRIFINGVETNIYTPKMNYYWMMGDNRHNSADSRYWGFVPEDHIVGKPIFIWLSIDEESGSVRWDRLFKKVHAN